MNWRLIPYSINSGQYNMDYDIALAKLCKMNMGFFRLYRWNPYCISLGANQSYNDVNTELAQSNNIDIVKRPTGGRAILHAEEITYSVIIPTKIGISAKQLYRSVSIALITGLSLYDDKLKELTLESDQPHFPSLLSADTGKLCFGSTARNEVKYRGKKIVGSAQRKLNNTLLQHGSILCGNYHRNLVRFINKEQTSALDLTNSTIEISEITGNEIDYQKLSDCLIEGFERTFSIKFNFSNNDEIAQVQRTMSFEFSN